MKRMRAGVTDLCFDLNISSSEIPISMYRMVHTNGNRAAGGDNGGWFSSPKVFIWSPAITAEIIPTSRGTAIHATPIRMRDTLLSALSVTMVSSFPGCEVPLSFDRQGCRVPSSRLAWILQLSAGGQSSTFLKKIKKSAPAMVRMIIGILFYFLIITGSPLYALLYNVLAALVRMLTHPCEPFLKCVLLLSKSLAGLQLASWKPYAPPINGTQYET